MPDFKRVDLSSLLGNSQSGPTYIANMFDVKASICPPPCECADCQHGYYATEEQYQPPFWYSGRVSDRDAGRIIAGHVQDAQREMQYLQQRLASHADIIVNRWKKKSREKRQALLVDTIPELCTHRWIIPRYCYMPESKQVGLGLRPWNRRCQLLLPWLSVEVLKMNPAVLFSLLHNRTAYPPQDWAPHDSRQLILSWACGYFALEYSGKCVIMYGPRYGELVDWEAGPAHRADIMGFPRARLVLEAQAYLMGCLRKIVDKILEGADLSKQATSEKWKAMTKLGFKHSGEAEYWSPYTNQPFSAPPVFDLVNILSIVQTRLNALGDHLGFLQTEPDYMRRYIRVLTQGERYKVIRGDIAGVMITQELFMDVLAHWWWSWVKTEFEHLKSVHDRFRDSIHQGDRLPPRYDKALGALELLLVNQVISQTRYLEVYQPQRPGFSHKWNFKQYPATETATHIQVSRKGTTEQKEVFDNDPLEWCLSQMQGLPDTQTNYDHAILFAFLENHLANSAPKERARIDEILYQKLSDLAAYHEMLVSVRLHRPQNTARVLDEVIQSENRAAWKRMNTKYILSEESQVTLGKSLLNDFYDVSSPLPGGKKNPSWLKHSQTLRKALETFWRGMRESSRGMLERSNFSAEEVNATLEIISANLSLEYIRTVEAEEQQVLAGIEITPVSTVVPSQREWGSSMTTEHSVPALKTKNKTRPAVQPEATEEVDNRVADITVDSSQEKASTITVKKRAFDVLTLMFPRTAEESAKSVDWDNFVYAMSDIGFVARNGGGSAVVFENKSLADGRDTGGKIVFHKPHPAPKIDPVMLHSYGKRMAKWFGWHRELFILES